MFDNSSQGLPIDLIGSSSQVMHIDLFDFSSHVLPIDLIGSGSQVMPIDVRQ